MEIEPGGAPPSLARWPLRRATLAGPLPGGARNLNLLVREADGSRYVLRCCRRNPDRDRILFQSDLHAAAADFAVPSVTDDTLPDLRRWWTHGEQELAGLRAMFAGADVGPELDYLDRWHGTLVSGLPFALVEDLVRGWLHSDFHGPARTGPAGGSAPMPPGRSSCPSG